MPCSHLILTISRIFCSGGEGGWWWWGESCHITPSYRVIINNYCILLFWHPCCVLLKVIFFWMSMEVWEGTSLQKGWNIYISVNKLCQCKRPGTLTVQAPLWGQEKIYIQSNLFNMDTKGTEPINCLLYRSVRIIELAGEICMIFGLSGTKQTVHNREVSVRRD